MYETREMIIPEDGEYLESSHQDYNVVDGKNVAGPVNDLVGEDLEGHLDLQNLDDGGILVKELTLENFDGGSFSVVGSSIDKILMQNRRQQLRKLGTGSGSEGFAGGSVNKETYHANESFWEEGGSLSDFLTQKPCNDEVTAQLTNTNCIVDVDASGALSPSPSGIRTKILSKSGFSQFFVKNTLKGKGVVCRPATPTSVGSDLQHQINTKHNDKSKVASDRSVRLYAKSTTPGKSVCEPEVSGITLREWLTNRDRRVKKAERLYLFRQIIDIVKLYHSQGVPIPDLHPSSFRVSSSNEVFYIGSLSKRDLNLESIDDDSAKINDQLSRKREFVDDVLASASSHAKKGKYVQDSTSKGWWLQQSSRSNLKHELKCVVAVNSCGTPDDVHKSGDDSGPSYYTMSDTSVVPGKSLLQLTFKSDQLEESWYTRPEDGRFSLATNIFSLGVLLFELLCCFDSEKARATAMSDLRYRILPPNFLAEYPQEVCLCLWLLHPEPISRPTLREVLQSKLTIELPNVYEDELSSIESQSIESELLSHFLVIARELKERASMKLAENLSVLEADIQDIGRRQSRKSLKPNFFSYRGSLVSRERSAAQPKFRIPYIAPQSHAESPLNDLRLFKNIHQLEGAYFSMRKNIQFPVSNHIARSEPAFFSRGGAQNRLNVTSEEKKEESDPVGTFFEGLSKYARYRKFEVRGVLRNPEINSASVICSLSFDRDQDYFAAAGVSKKIKIFDYRAFFNLSVDIHYPETEMLNQSKLNSICWNPYIKNYLASADYDGAVKLWDASTGVDFAQYTEHRKRAWSVDFSLSDPTKLASGSDDFSVKLWSITQKKCSGTIKSHANICCVQFSPHSSNLLAFGSADYKAYCYDIRYPRSPWCTLAGHGKAVSHLKFIDSKTIVSASTDNTLKLWDLSKTTPDGQSIDACTMTFRGHTNEKNFVGLSVEDGFIACGSETNEVFTYYKSLPIPITTHKFGSIDPVSGKQTFEENGHFLSSVCWRKNSDTIIAANSSGCIKVLQMV